MADSKKMEHVFGEVTLTLTPDDIEKVMANLETELGRKMTGADSGKFADAMIEHMTANAKPTRTVLHN